MEEKKEERADSGAKNCGSAFGEALAAAAINEMKRLSGQVQARGEASD